MQFKLIALLTLAIASVNGGVISSNNSTQCYKRATGTCTCGPTSYTCVDTQNALNQAATGPYIFTSPRGRQNILPHTFGNRENLAFPACTAPFNEFPIYPNGALFDGTANPGLDRIVYDNNGNFCGCITHYQQINNGFALCPP